MKLNELWKEEYLQYKKEHSTQETTTNEKIIYKIVSLKYLPLEEIKDKRLYSMEEKFFLSQNKNLPYKLQKRVIGKYISSLHIVENILNNSNLQKETVEYISHLVFDNNLIKENIRDEVIIEICKSKLITTYSISKILLEEDIFFNLYLIKNENVSNKDRNIIGCEYKRLMKKQ